MWILVIVAWGLNSASGVAVGVVPGFHTQKSCEEAAKAADGRYSTYDAYCIKQPVTLP